MTDLLHYSLNQFVVDISAKNHLEDCLERGVFTVSFTPSPEDPSETDTKTKAKKTRGKKVGRVDVKVVWTNVSFDEITGEEITGEGATKEFKGVYGYINPMTFPSQFTSADTDEVCNSYENSKYDISQFLLKCYYTSSGVDPLDIETASVTTSEIVEPTRLMKKKKKSEKFRRTTRGVCVGMKKNKQLMRLLGLCGNYSIIPNDLTTNMISKIVFYCEKSKKWKLR